MFKKSVTMEYNVSLSALLLHKSGTIIYLLLSESHHHLAPSNVTSKLTSMLKTVDLTEFLCFD